MSNGFSGGTGLFGAGAGAVEGAVDPAESGGDCVDCAPNNVQAKQNAAVKHRNRGALLFQRIDRQTIQKFGIEVGRLLRQHAACERDVAHFAHPNRVHQERDVRLA